MFSAMRDGDYAARLRVGGGEKQRDENEESIIVVFMFGRRVGAQFHITLSIRRETRGEPVTMKVRAYYLLSGRIFGS